MKAFLKIKNQQKSTKILQNTLNCSYLLVINGEISIFYTFLFDLLRFFRSLVLP